MILTPELLAARALPEGPPPDGRDVHAGVCVFCGQPAEHVNDSPSRELEAWLCHGRFEEGGPVSSYLYHNRDCTGAGPHATGPLTWRCGCIADYVDNLGTHCCECGRARADCLPCWNTVICPECYDDTEAREPGGPIRLRCLRCGWQGHYDGVRKGPVAGDPPGFEPEPPSAVRILTFPPRLQVLFHQANRKPFGDAPAKLMYLKYLGRRMRIVQASDGERYGLAIRLDGREIAYRGHGTDAWIVADRWYLEHLKVTRVPARAVVPAT